MEYEKHKEGDVPSPDMCAKAGKCLMKEMMDKMIKQDYDKLSDEEKDNADKKEVIGDE